jgi:EmrB/QacA subfamily drug resistance transporter
VFQVAIAIFVLGSVLSGLAAGMLQLIVFRGIQGAGAGGLMAMSMAIMGDIVSPRQRGRYTGYMSVVFAVASIAGPLAGGFLVDHVSWRWIFYINVPIGIVALFVTSAVLRLPFRKVPRRIDFEGSVLLVAAVTCVLLVSVWGGNTRSWGSPAIVSLAAAGVFLIGLFVAQERRAREPILPLRLFRNDIFSVSSALSFLVGSAMFGAMVFLPVYLQAVTGATATDSGLLLLPLMGGFVSMSVLSGRIITRTGHYRSWPVAGMGVAIFGMSLLARMQVDTPRLESSVYMAVLGAGIGMAMQVLILAVQNAVAHRDLGVATSAISFFRQMGGTFGVAVFGAVFSSRLQTALGQLVPARMAGVINHERLANSPAEVRALSPALRSAVVEGLSQAVHTVFVFAIPLLFVGFVVSWRLRQIPLRETVHVGNGANEVSSVPDGIQLGLVKQRYQQRSRGLAVIRKLILRRGV